MRQRRIWTHILLAVLLVCVGSWRSQPVVRAQGEAGVALDVTMMLELFPQLHQLPAPEWLREGTRLTYRVETAGFDNYHPDPYTRMGSGMAYLQYDVVALERSSAALNVQYFLDNGAGNVVPTGSGAAFGLPAVSEVWINPAVLATAESSGYGRVRVVRGVRQDGAGRNRRVVILRSANIMTDAVWEFEEETGLLVFASQRVDDRLGHLKMTRSLLVEARQIELPWQSRRAPNWVRANTVSRFAGVYATILADGTQGEMPYALNATITQKSARWSLADLTFDSNGLPGGAQLTVSGVGQPFGALWLPAEALKARPAQTLLDRDPVTGAELFWQRGENRAIVLTERGAAYETVLTYDGTTGALLGIQQFQHGLTGATQIWLEYVGTQVNR
jgi:hypothetical protein